MIKYRWISGGSSAVECPAVAGRRRFIVSDRFYIGSTNDIKRRLEEHNRGQTKSTKRKGQWVVVYKEEFDNYLEAKRRESKIKSYKGGNAFKKLIAGVVYR